MCVYTCVCVHVYLCGHVYVYLCVCASLCVCVCACVCVRVGERTESIYTPSQKHVSRESWIRHDFYFPTSAYLNLLFKQ